MKGFLVQQQPVVEENMSNLTSQSGDHQASVSSGTRAENSNTYQQSLAPQNPPPTKKKRNLPGNPDPDAEVIALSPKTLLATNRFVCEICNKGFQRDQNLQLHRRGHNLPWKLRQRTSKDIKKKVYICPEPSCVHHDPSRALGDLTGIKKHFCRKHGEKKWKCDKCSKRYAVQSDWKAHSKTCGTREYRCDCGTLFSRRDSFITHRAFCDALAEESAKAITPNPLNNIQSSQSNNMTPIVLPNNISSHVNLQVPQFNHMQTTNTHDLNPLSLTKSPFQIPNQQQPLSLKSDIPPWLSYPSMVGPSPNPPPTTSMAQLDLPNSLFSSRLEQEFSNSQNPIHQENASPHMSATALLQKAAQMGATMTKPSSIQGPHLSHTFGLGLSSREEIGNSFVHGLTAFGNKAAMVLDQTETSPSLFSNVMSSSFSSASGFQRSYEEETIGGLLGSKRDSNENMAKSQLKRNEGGGGNDGLTRDFLGLRAFSHRDILNMAGLETCMNSNLYEQTHDSQKPWHG